MKINNQIFLIIDNLRNNFKIYLKSQLFLIICFGVFSVMPFQINNEKIFFNIIPLNKENISLEDYNYMLLLSQKPLSIIAPLNSTDLEKKFKEQVNKELFNYKKSKIKKKSTTRKNLLMHEINVEGVSNSLKELENPNLKGRFKTEDINLVKKELTQRLIKEYVQINVYKKELEIMDNELIDINNYSVNFRIISRENIKLISYKKLLIIYLFLFFLVFFLCDIFCTIKKRYKVKKSRQNNR